MSWRVAKSLLVLREQVNEAYPNRRKASNGTIGNEEHQSRSSDHNPWVRDGKTGVVTALDLTHDPERGFNAAILSEAIRAEQDARVKYVIFGRRIFYGDYKDYPKWKWTPYHGLNPHTSHIHISVKADKHLYDSQTLWQLGLGALPEERESDPKVRAAAAKIIYNREVRRKAGVPIMYIPSDGSREFAGINSRYHERELSKIEAALAEGRAAKAEELAIDFIARYTDPAADWHKDNRVDVYLRDVFFNRGPRGAARILQRALGVEDDGVVGPETRAALNRVGATELLPALRRAREQYERDVLKRDESSDVWRGLVDRWDFMLEFAKKVSK